MSRVSRPRGFRYVPDVRGVRDVMSSRVFRSARRVRGHRFC